MKHVFMTNRFNVLKYLLCFVMLAIMMPSCSDDDHLESEDPENPTELPILGSLQKDVVVGSSITVKCDSQLGYAGFFSIKPFADEDMRYMLVHCSEDYSFSVLNDPDSQYPFIRTDVTNGSILELYDEPEKLCVFNNSFQKKKFEVTFTGVTPVNEKALLVGFTKKLVGVSLSLDGKYVRYRLRATDSQKEFYLKHTDVTCWDDIKHGNMFNRPIDHTMMGVGVSSSGESSICHLLIEPVDLAWMEGIDDNTPIGKISIPGTHDTGTYALEPVNFGLSKCQNMDLAQQLDMGIRLFDMRVDGMGLTHGGIPCNVGFDKMIDESIQFLDEHPSETLIFALSDEGGGMPKKFMDYITNKDYKKRFFLENRMPKLGEVRGKIVLLRKFVLKGEVEKEDPNKWGLDFVAGPNDDRGSFKSSGGFSYYIQDRFFYTPFVEHNTGEKTQLFNETFDYAQNAKEDVVINYSSISASFTHTPYMYMWGGSGIRPSMCEGVFQKLYDLKGKKAKVGWIFMDYPTNNLIDDNRQIVERIINTNYEKDQWPIDDVDHYNGTKCHKGLW